MRKSIVNNTSTASQKYARKITNKKANSFPRRPICSIPPTCRPAKGDR